MVTCFQWTTLFHYIYKLLSLQYRGIKHYTKYFCLNTPVNRVSHYCWHHLLSYIHTHTTHTTHHAFSLSLFVLPFLGCLLIRFNLLNLSCVPEYSICLYIVSIPIAFRKWYGPSGMFDVMGWLSYSGVDVSFTWFVHDTEV